MLPDFQILSFEAVDKGGMLSVFVFISCSGRLEKTFLEALGLLGAKEKKTSS